MASAAVDADITVKRISTSMGQANPVTLKKGDEVD